MNKYFFDLVGNDHAEYDYKGRVFSAPEKAFALAELMALDLEVHGPASGPGGASRCTMRTVNTTFPSRCESSELLAA